MCKISGITLTMSRGLHTIICNRCARFQQGHDISKRFEIIKASQNLVECVMNEYINIKVLHTEHITLLSLVSLHLLILCKRDVSFLGRLGCGRKTQAIVSLDPNKSRLFLALEQYSHARGIARL